MVFFNPFFSPPDFEDLFLNNEWKTNIYEIEKKNLLQDLISVLEISQKQFLFPKSVPEAEALLLSSQSLDLEAKGKCFSVGIYSMFDILPCAPAWHSLIELICPSN